MFRTDVDDKTNSFTVTLTNKLVSKTVNMIFPYKHDNPSLER
jgi:hypothetical protein